MFKRNSIHSIEGFVITHSEVDSLDERYLNIYGRERHDDKIGIILRVLKDQLYDKDGMSFEEFI